VEKDDWPLALVLILVIVLLVTLALLFLGPQVSQIVTPECTPPPSGQVCEGV
jgi:hypothetical protein